MKILFLHGLDSRPGGTKPTLLAQRGHEVANPALPRDRFEESVRIAQAEFDAQRPQVVVGSSRGGAVAMAIDSAGARLLLIAPAWKWYATPGRVPASTIILHAQDDEAVPLAHSRELAEASALPQGALRVVGESHNMNDPAALAALVAAVEK